MGNELVSTINHTTLVKNVYSCIRHKKADCILEICLFSGIKRQGRGVLVFWGFSGDALTASRASVATLAIFASRGGCKNACWGASPNPTRRRGLRILRFAASGKAYSLCRTSSPHATRCAGLARGPQAWDKLSQSLLSASPLLIAPVPCFCARPTGRADDRYSP